MSECFRSFAMPCDECIVQAICKDKDQVPVKHVLKKFIGIPKWDYSEKTYHKGLLECWANLGFDIIRSTVGKAEDPSCNQRIVFINYLLEISNLLQWIVNSKSWEDGEEYSFDINEIKYKAKQAMGWIPKS